MLSLQEDGNCAVKPRGPRRTWWIDAVYGLVNVCFPSEATHEKQRTHLPHQWAQESGRHVSESRRRSVEIKSGSGWFEPCRWVKKLPKKTCLVLQMKTRWVRPSPFWSRFINTASIIWSTQTTTLKCEKQTIFLTNSGWKDSIFRAVVSNHQKKKATKSICNDFPVSIYSQFTYSVWSLFSWTRRWWSHRDWRQRQTKNFFNSSEAGHRLVYTVVFCFDYTHFTSLL